MYRAADIESTDVSPVLPHEEKVEQSGLICGV